MASVPTEAKWLALKPGYRERLIRSGFTLQDYLANNPRTKGRGHGKTPEHPNRATEERYPEYVAKRRKREGPKLAPLVDRVVIHARQMFGSAFGAGTIDRVDIIKIEQHVRQSPPSLQRDMLTMDLGTWQAMAQRSASDFDIWAGTHWVNPFWYH